jgi:hypothetical protein
MDESQLSLSTDSFPMGTFATKQGRKLTRSTAPFSLGRDILFALSREATTRRFLNNLSISSHFFWVDFSIKKSPCPQLSKSTKLRQPCWNSEVGEA